MVKKIIKFPLKMKNGAEVRSLEELRANADVESVMQYYFSGQLSRWCRAFNINELPEKITENNEMFVKRVLETIGIKLPAEDIHNYVNNNFGNSAEVKAVPDTDEEKITDDKEVKNRLKNIMDGEINFDDYKIEVTPIEDESGTIKKYRVCITNEKTEQYRRFVVSYELDNDWTEESLEKDLLKKIKYVVENEIKSIKKFNQKIGFNSSLNVGDTFEFGCYNGKKIEWKVLSKSDSSMYVISTEILCERAFRQDRKAKDANVWEKSDIRKWLNGEFYNDTFTENEKEKIGIVGLDKVTLLSKEEAESMMTQKEKAVGDVWWLRSANLKYSNVIYFINDGKVDYNVSDMDFVHLLFGIRPAINLNF